MRKNEISLLNVLYCLIVIFIHCISSAVVSLSPGTVSHAIVFTLSKMSTFVVQGFIFLSGLKHFLKEDSASYGRFLCAKLKAIILPYIIWCGIYFIYFSLVNNTPFEFTALIKGILTGNLCYHLYYIVILSQLFILFPLWKKLFTKENALIILPAVTILTSVCTNGLPGIIKVFLPNVDFIYNDRIFTTYLLYWTLGCYAGIYYNEFTKALIKSKKTVCIMFTTVSFFNVYLSYASIKGTHYIPVLGSMHILYCICAVLFTYLTALWLKDSPLIKSTLFRIINKSSYGIYLSHSLFLAVTDSVIINAVNPKPIALTLIRLGVVYIASVGLCSLYTIVKSFLTKKKNVPASNAPVNIIQTENNAREEHASI